MLVLQRGKERSIVVVLDLSTLEWTHYIVNNEHIEGVL